MKKIETLVEDIHKVFLNFHEFDEERLAKFGTALAKSVQYKINAEGGKPSLRLSNFGTKCNRKLWYSLNTPNDAEKLPVEARIKFLYGDVLEELLLFLAEEAGHTVQGRQSELDLYGIKGHRDAIIDGVLVDVKSASSFAFQKFKSHLNRETDSFGYIDQLQGYLQASQADEELVDKNRCAFFVIDKTLGHIHLDMHQKTDLDYERLVQMKKAAVQQPEAPVRYYSDEPEGASGNRKLCVECSYCQFKKKCWPSLRTFVYSRGPTFLTQVKREPNVPEA